VRARRTATRFRGLGRGDWTASSASPRVRSRSRVPTSTWTSNYLPPQSGPPPPSPFIWGDPAGVRQYLDARVKDVLFEHRALQFPALNAGHKRRIMEETFAPVAFLVHALSDQPEKLSAWRRQHDAIASDFLTDGRVRFEYLLTRATRL